MRRADWEPPEVRVHRAALAPPVPRKEGVMQERERAVKQTPEKMKMKSSVGRARESKAQESKQRSPSPGSPTGAGKVRLGDKHLFGAPASYGLQVTDKGSLVLSPPQRQTLSVGNKYTRSHLEKNRALGLPRMAIKRPSEMQAQYDGY